MFRLSFIVVCHKVKRGKRHLYTQSISDWPFETLPMIISSFFCIRGQKFPKWLSLGFSWIPIWVTRRRKITKRPQLVKDVCEVKGAKQLDRERHYLTKLSFIYFQVDVSDTEIPYSAYWWVVAFIPNLHYIRSCNSRWCTKLQPWLSLISSNANANVTEDYF